MILRINRIQEICQNIDKQNKTQNIKNKQKQIQTELQIVTIRGSKRQNWTLEQRKKVVWSDEPHFPHMFTREEMAPGCTVGRKQPGGGNVMLWAMFFWETLGPGIHVDVNLTCATYLNMVVDQVHPFMAWVTPATLHRLFGNGSRNITSSRCCSGFQIP